LNTLKVIISQSNILLLMLLMGITLSITSCQSSDPNPDVNQVSSTSRIDTELILNNAVLEQSNKQSNTVWKIKANNIVYSEDKKIATLTKVVGNLFQNDMVILKISAESGEVRNQGNIILLENQVIASDPRNNSVINSEQVEWRPQDNLLLIKSKLIGNHPNLKVVAKSGRYFTDTEKLEIEKDVEATTKQPALQLTSDRLEWNIPQGQVISPGSMKLVRYDQEQTVVDQLISDRAELNLQKHQATLNKNIELITSEPPLQVATDFLTWNYQSRIGKTDQPIQILDRDRHIDLTGNQGEINLQQQLATLQNGVQGINKKTESELYARKVTWKLDTEQVEATGNVIYEQVKPKARLTGEKAIGTLGNSNITVIGNDKQPVTSVIDN
jgi:LPS export ABC transporter protein LptC